MDRNQFEEIIQHFVDHVDRVALTPDGNTLIVMIPVSDLMNRVVSPFDNGTSSRKEVVEEFVKAVGDEMFNRS